MTPAPGSPEWSLCRQGGWLFTWDGSPHPPTVTPRRPTARALARATVTRGIALPPNAPGHHWLNPHFPGHLTLGQLPAGVRHWWWWHRHLDRAHLHRGNLTPLVGDPRPPNLAPTPPTRVDLRDTGHYSWLIGAAMTTDLWVRRYRGPFRRRVTLALTPPREPGLRRTLLWAHHPRADLSWAPRPPRPEVRDRRATLLIRALLLIAFGPIGLLLIAFGVGQVGHSPTSTARYRSPTTQWGPGSPLWRATYIDPYVLPRHPAHRAVRPTPGR